MQHEANTAFRLAVLASGRGSNLQALIDAIESDQLDARIAGVFSDRRDAYALERAQKYGIPSFHVAPKKFASRQAFDAALFAEIGQVTPDLVVCAGYMRILGAEVLIPYTGRMINIHPSLLPAFKGLHTHRQALEAQVTEHGASVHFVTAELDGGPVIAQARVPVLANDDEQTLAARVLEVEHPLLVQTVKAITERRVQLTEHGIIIDGEKRPPLQLAATQTFA